MPITVKEVRRSRSRTLEGEEREYMAWGSDNPDEIEAAVEAAAPPTVNGYVVTGYSQRPTDEDESVFDAVVSYGIAPTEDTTELSFELSMVTSHITQPLARVATFGENVPNLPGIGFDGEKYEGTDIQIPVFSWRETVTRTTVDNAYLGQLMACAANPVNSADFRGFAPGEVLYVGCSGATRGNKFSLTHAFSASPNLTALSIGTITEIAKAGWNYLWVLYEKSEDEDNKFITDIPRAVYVEQVYGTSNLASQLEI
jgi:hypothetical protein